MPRTARTRAARATQTAPNSGSVRDLAVFGSSEATTTIARFSGVGGPNTIRVTPNAVSSTQVALPAVGAAQANVGWRDPVAENSSEPVRYDAGTWSTQWKTSKSGQTLATDIVVRLTWIVYEVTSSGGFVKEIGRSSVDQAITAGNPTPTPASSFSPGAVDLGANNRAHAEAYVQTLDTLGSVAAPAAAVDVHLHTDGSANNNNLSMRTPAYVILFRRSLTDTAGASDVVARAAVVARSVLDAAPASDTVPRTARLPRSVSDTASATDAVERVAARPRAVSDTAAASDVVARAVVGVRAVTDSAPAFDLADRIINYVRNVTDNIGPSGAGGDAPVTPQDIAAIANAVWDELTSEQRAAGSYGAIVAARLDAAVSSRATSAEATADPAGVTALLSRLNASRAALLDALALLDVAVSSRARPQDVSVTVTPAPTGTVS